MGVVFLAELSAHFLDEGAEVWFFGEAAVVDAEGDGLGVVEGNGAEVWGSWCKQRRQHGDSISCSNEGGGCFDGVAEEDVGEGPFAHEAVLEGDGGRGGVRRREHGERCLAQVVEVEGGGAGERVVAGAEADHGHVAEGGEGAAFVERVLEADDGVEVAVVEAAEDVLEGDDVQPRMQGRVVLVEGGEGVGEAEEGGEVVGAEVEDVDAVVLGVDEAASGAAGDFEHLAGVAEEEAAAFGELDGTGAALEKGGAELFFEVADLLAHGRVGDVEVFGGFGEVEVFGDGEEAAKLVGVHGQVPF